MVHSRDNPMVLCLRQAKLRLIPPVYYAEMSRLQLDHPEVYEQSMQGGSTVQLGEKNPFGRIPVDQTLEETVNMDTQTAGGTKGFSLNPKQFAGTTQMLNSGART